MQLIGKLLLGGLLLIFGLLTLGMGVCAISYTSMTSGFSLLFGLPLTGILGFIVFMIWKAFQETDSSNLAPSNPPPPPLNEDDPL